MELKSGKQWVLWANVHAPNSNKVSDLDVAFRGKVEGFIKALSDGGARIQVNATRRSKKRAYLFHWSWLIAQRNVKPNAIPSIYGVSIQWDHGNESASILGALEMTRGFNLAMWPKSKVAPALSSNHIAGLAIDMDITWSGKIKVRKKNGEMKEVTFSNDPNTNKGLIDVGTSYGVYKLTSDAPHWSFNGR